MTPDAAVRQWFTEVWNGKNEAAIDQLMAPESVVHGLGGTDGGLRGPAGFKQVFHAFHGALDNIHVTVEKTIVEGEFCSALCHVRGHHGGNGFGVPPTGRTVDFTGIIIVRVVNGKLVEGWNSFDFLTMYQQLGLVKDPIGP